MSRGYVPLQHRGLPDTPDEGEFVESGSIRASLRGSVIVGHHTRESFMRAVSRPIRGESPPIPEGYSAAEARAGLRRIWTRNGPAPPRTGYQSALDSAADRAERVFGPPAAEPKISGRSDSIASQRGREVAELLEDPELATDAEIRRAMRTGREQ